MLTDKDIQELYGIYYCRKCECKIDKQQKHPMVCAEPIPFSPLYPLCEKHARELVAIDLSNGDTYEPNISQEQLDNAEIVRLLTEMHKTECCLTTSEFERGVVKWEITLQDQYEGSDYFVADNISLLECLREAELKGWKI